MLLKEFGEVDNKKKIGKIIYLYCKKCWNVLYQGGKFNGKVYNHLTTVILNNFEQADLATLYKYLLSIEAQNMTIWECMKRAREFNLQEKSQVEKEKIASLQIKEYDDYLGDLL